MSPSPDQFRLRTLAVLATLILTAAHLPGGQLLAQTEQSPPQTPGDSASADDIQVLDEGPLHEAFAEPVSPHTDSGIVVERQPPEPVDEIPPAVRPEGENVEWIPGYWFWLDERDDFIWISGVWRSIPPGRVWTPGHWTKDPEGYRWVHGFWNDVESPEVTYLPSPPDTLDNGPNSPQPSNNHFWIPGCWRWENNQYGWRPGYWYPGQSNWVWVPHHYRYTPRGAIFVHGYWDYPVPDRGLLYAPVRWRRGYGGHRYSPSHLVNSALLLTSLFIDSDRGYYYYGQRYRDRGNFYPWYAGRQRGVYNPLYSYYSWQLGPDSDRWRDRFDDGFRRRSNNAEGRQSVDRPTNLVVTLDELRRSTQDNGRNQRSDISRRLRDLSEEDQQAVRERVRNLDRFRTARSRFEAQRDDDDASRPRSDNAETKEPGNQKNRTADRNPLRTLDLRTVDGAQQLRQRAKERTRFEVMRPNFDEVEDSRQRARGNRQGRQDAASERNRANRQATPRQNEGRESNQRDFNPRRQRIPEVPRGRNIQRGDDQRQNAQRGRNVQRGDQRPNAQRSPSANRPEVKRGRNVNRNLERNRGQRSSGGERRSPGNENRGGGNKKGDEG